jgi:peptide/nickel transport system ATP-binding protein
MTADAAPLLEVEGLRKHFAPRGFLQRAAAARATIKAVDGVSFRIEPGENYGLVGESGSGKSTVAKVVLRLEEPTAGTVRFRGQDVQTLAGGDLRRFRQATHAVFQDPGSSLNPRMRVRDIVGEPLMFVPGVTTADRQARVADALQVVGLGADAAGRFPHEFSGGQRQRIAVARAIAGRPALIVLDEPVSALDVSIRAQILNLLKDLQEQLGLTYLTIAHDLAVMYLACTTIGVMYLGRMMEEAPTEALYTHPRHPYTVNLLASIPQPDPDLRGRRQPLTGEIPSPADPPSGCVFRTRCPLAIDDCARVVPEWREVAPGHRVACIRV